MVVALSKVNSLDSAVSGLSNRTQGSAQYLYLTVPYATKLNSTVFAYEIETRLCKKIVN